MSAAPGTSQFRTLLMPLLTLGAVGALVAAAFLPAPSFRPSIGPIRGEPLGPDGQQLDIPKLPEPNDWEALSGPLGELRTPLPVVEKPPPEKPPIVTEVEENREPPPPTVPTARRLNWSYVGYIEGADHTSALVVVNGGRTELLREGQTYRDPANPTQRVLIKSVIPANQLIIEYEGTEQRIPFSAGGTDSGELTKATSPLANPRFERARRPNR